MSDTSYDELHAFATAHGIPRRGFERDHYDVPAHVYAELVAAGALPVSGKELLERLTAAGLRRRRGAAPAPRRPGRPLLRPPRLRPGDVVAVPAPAGPVRPDRLAAGVERLESWGLRVQVSPHALDTSPLGYLAGSDADRAADFRAAWLSPEVAAVVCARGGYGCQRMVDWVDWRRLAEARPKILVGFSDATVLHEAVANRLGLVTVHGHAVTSLGTAAEASAEQLRRLLFDPAALDLFEGHSVRSLVTGSTDGVLLGGNLSLLASSVGTASSRPATGGIVVLEDVDEDLYRIDRLLTQLLRSGWFDGVRGVVLGDFSTCAEQSSIDALALDRLAGLGVPVGSGYDLGHTTTTTSVALGVPAHLVVPESGRPSLRLAYPPLQ